MRPPFDAPAPCATSKTAYLMTAKPISNPSTSLGHRERLRQRLELEPAAVADYEVLELLLGYGLTRKDTKPLAKDLMKIANKLCCRWRSSTGRAADL